MQAQKKLRKAARCKEEDGEEDPDRKDIEDQETEEGVSKAKGRGRGRGRGRGSQGEQQQKLQRKPMTLMLAPPLQLRPPKQRWKERDSDRPRRMQKLEKRKLKAKREKTRQTKNLMTTRRTAKENKHTWFRRLNKWKGFSVSARPMTRISQTRLDMMSHRSHQSMSHPQWPRPKKPPEGGGRRHLSREGPPRWLRTGWKKQRRKRKPRRTGRNCYFRFINYLWNIHMLPAGIAGCCGSWIDVIRAAGWVPKEEVRSWDEPIKILTHQKSCMRSFTLQNPDQDPALDGCKSCSIGVMPKSQYAKLKLEKQQLMEKQLIIITKMYKAC